MEKIQLLGSKNNSKVELVRLDNGAMAVIKYYPIYSRSMIIELNILATCIHTNIVKMIDIIPSSNGKYCIMVMEKEDDNFADHLQNISISYAQKLILLLQIAYGIRYLHVNNIVHLDLKSANIMITNGVCKIIDFGLSEYIFTDKITTLQLKCTYTHRPPEAFATSTTTPNKFVIDRSFDIWSFGIIILELFTGIQMHHSKDFQYINNGNRDDSVYSYFVSDMFRYQVQQNIPIELQSCLSIDCKSRPNITQVIGILTDMLTCRQIIYQFDASIKPKQFYVEKNIRNSYSNHLCNKTSYAYINLPKQVRWYTDSLVTRLTQNRVMLTKIYLDHIIFLCHHMIINIFSFKSLGLNSKIDPIIINDIITKTNGVIFHYNFN